MKEIFQLAFTQSTKKIQNFLISFSFQDRMENSKKSFTNSTIALSIVDQST